MDILSTNLMCSVISLNNAARVSYKAPVTVSLTVFQKIYTECSDDVNMTVSQKYKSWYDMLLKSTCVKFNFCHEKVIDVSEMFFGKISIRRVKSI